MRAGRRQSADPSVEAACAFPTMGRGGGGLSGARASMADGVDVVLGGGLAGLTAAYTLQEGGVECVVLEREERPGGHARSVVVDGYVFDFGPHILFTNDTAMEALIRDLLGDNMRAQERQAFI